MIKNERRITKEFCQGRTILFYPATPGEAEFIQRKVFAMGFSWADKNMRNTIGYGDACTRYGMTLIDGKLGLFPDKKASKIGLVCASNQFDEEYRPDMELLKEQFAQFAARQEEMSRKLDELIGKVDDLYEEVKPKALDKPVIGRPKHQSGA